MLASTLAVLSFKMLAYVTLLLLLTARIGHWKRAYTEASAQLISANKQKDMLEDTLTEVGKQVAIWQAKANAEAVKVRAAIADAAALREEYDAKAKAILNSEVADPIGFLRKEATT